MTLQQHAPRIEHARPPLAISPATLITIGIVIIAVLAAVAIWALFESGTPNADYFQVEQQLQELRMITGGFI